MRAKTANFFFVFARYRVIIIHSQGFRFRPEALSHTYIDCELSDKQFQLRYTSEDGRETHVFPPGFFRAEIDPMFVMPRNAEEVMLQHIEDTAEQLGCDTVMVDNISYLCNNMDKGADAGSFMQKLKMIKIKHGWNLLIIAHTPKRALCSPITRNDLAGSSRLFNFFDSIFAIGQSAKDHDLRYIKQVKVRHGKFEYGPDNVITCEIVKDGCFAHFRELGRCPEREHLKERSRRGSFTGSIRSANPAPTGAGRRWTGPPCVRVILNSAKDLLSPGRRPCL